MVKKSCWKDFWQSPEMVGCGCLVVQLQHGADWKLLVHTWKQCAVLHPWLRVACSAMQRQWKTDLHHNFLHMTVSNDGGIAGRTQAYCYGWVEGSLKNVLYPKDDWNNFQIRFRPSKILLLGRKISNCIFYFKIFKSNNSKKESYSYNSISSWLLSSMKILKTTVVISLQLISLSMLAL